MLVIGMNQGGGKRRITRFLAHRGGRVGSLAAKFDSWRNRRQLRKRGWNI